MEKETKILPANKFVLVEKFDKATKSDQAYADIVTNENLGTIIWSASLSFAEGHQIYFGKDYQKLVIQGREIYAMNPENIIAVVS